MGLNVGDEIFEVERCLSLFNEEVLLNNKDYRIEKFYKFNEMIRISIVGNNSYIPKIFLTEKGTTILTPCYFEEDISEDEFSKIVNESENIEERLKKFNLDFISSITEWHNYILKRKG